jgi:site-specific DNA recombinase
MKDRMQVDEIIKHAKNFGIYKRVSTEEQDNEKRQNQEIQRYLDQQGIHIDDDKKYDDTKSAYRLPYEKREGFQNLINAAKEKKIDGVIVSDIDRISRQTQEHFELRKLFEELGLPVIIASKGELYRKPDTKDLLKQLIEDGFTKLESDNISVRTRDALQKIRREKKYAGGAIPFGYRVDDSVNKVRVGDEVKVNGVTEVSEEIKIVKSIFQLFQGGKTFKDIADLFNKDGIYGGINKKGQPQKWYAKKVKYILSNPFYTGHIVYNRKTGDHSFAPLNQWVWVNNPWISEPPISKELFLTCWKRYEKSKDKNRYYHNTPYYFQDILRCSCGEIMTGINQRTKSKTVKDKKDGFRYYKCTCGIKIQADSLHNLFKEFYYGLPLPYELVFNEVKERFQIEAACTKKNLEEWREELKKEQQILLEIKRFPKGESKLLNEIQNPMDIALLIGENQSRENIEYLEKKIKDGENYLSSLHLLLDSEADLKAAIGNILKSMEVDKDDDICEDDEVNSRFMRSIVLIMVKECGLTPDRQVELSFYMMPPKSLSPEIRYKGA